MEGHSCCNSSFGVIQNLGISTLLSVLAYLVYLYIVKPWMIMRQLWSQGVKGPPYWPLIGQAFEIKKQMERLKDAVDDPHMSAVPFLDACAARYGPVFCYTVGSQPTLCVLEPSMVRQVYVDNDSCYRKSAHLKSLGLLGGGLLTADGASWQRQRRLINPAFNHKEIKSMTGTMVECATHAMAAWDRHLAPVAAELDARARPAELDMHAELSRVTLAIIGRAFFGADLADRRAADLVSSNLQTYFERKLKDGREMGIVWGHQ
eukprot:jgi/Mesen1/3477/ME000195S02624